MNPKLGPNFCHWGGAPAGGGGRRTKHPSSLTVSFLYKHHDKTRGGLGVRPPILDDDSSWTEKRNRLTEQHCLLVSLNYNYMRSTTTHNIITEKRGLGSLPQYHLAILHTILHTLLHTNIPHTISLHTITWKDFTPHLLLDNSSTQYSYTGILHTSNRKLNKLHTHYIHTLLLNRLTDQTNLHTHFFQ